MAKIIYPDNQLSSPAWAGDFLDRNHLLPGAFPIDVSKVPRTTGFYVFSDTAASGGATTVNIYPLPKALPLGASVVFGSVTATLTAPAAAGAYSISVSAISGPIPSLAVGIYEGEGNYALPSGSLILSGTQSYSLQSLIPIGSQADLDDLNNYDIFLTAFDAPNLEKDPHVVLYRPNSVVRTDNLPGWELPEDVILLLKKNYILVSGQP